MLSSDVDNVVHLNDIGVNELRILSGFREDGGNLVAWRRRVRLEEPFDCDVAIQLFVRSLPDRAESTGSDYVMDNVPMFEFSSFSKLQHRSLHVCAAVSRATWPSALSRLFRAA